MAELYTIYFPPFSLLSKVINKIVDDQVEKANAEFLCEHYFCSNTELVMHKIQLTAQENL